MPHDKYDGCRGSIQQMWRHFKNTAENEINAKANQ